MLMRPMLCMSYLRSALPRLRVKGVTDLRDEANLVGIDCYRYLHLMARYFRIRIPRRQNSLTSAHLTARIHSAIRSRTWPLTAIGARRLLSRIFQDIPESSFDTNALFNAGYSPSNIAIRRRLSIETVNRHLALVDRWKNGGRIPN